MKDFMQLCLERQSCRSFSDQPVEHEKLVKCVEAARLSHSGCNAQPWSYVIVENPEIVEQIAVLSQQIGLNAFTSKAKAFAIVLEEHAILISRIRCMIDSQYFAKFDLGSTVAYFCLEAQEQGLGTCILGLYDRDKIKALAGIPQEKMFSSLIAIGYPAEETAREKVRKPMEEIVRYV